MVNRHHEKADKIICAFREPLDEKIRQQITDSQFDVLALMSRGVLTDELAIAAELVEEVVRKLRAESEKTGL